MGVTLNKDGKPRKIGSGKTKGAGCFAKIKWEQLREFIKDDENILVSRVWLRSVGALNQKKGLKKKPLQSVKSIVKKPSMDENQKTSTSLQKSNEAPKKTNEDEDDSPPLFASFGEIKNY